MALFENMSVRTRRNTLAVIMLGVLLVSTAIAWVMTVGRSGARPGETWYLITDAENAPVGWQVTQRSDRGAEGSSGYTVKAIETDSSMSWSQWRLDASGQNGRYLSVDAVIDGGQPAPRLITRIAYEGDKLVVRRESQGRAVVTPASVGPDYIAEGRLIPAIVSVARSGQAASGEMVIDPLGLPVPLSLEPQGRQGRAVGERNLNLSVVTLRWQTKDFSASGMRFFVAEDGSIPLIEQIDTNGNAILRMTAADLDSVRKFFPSAHWSRTRVLRGTGGQ